MSLKNLSVLLIYSMKARDIFRQDVIIVYVIFIDTCTCIQGLLSKMSHFVAQLDGMH